MRTSNIGIAAVALLALQPCLAQPPIGCDPPSTRARIIVLDNGSKVDTLWFGFDISARYTIDPPLCEIELPPLPPSGVFHTLFRNIPGREGLDPPLGLGVGTKQDYRHYEGRADIDTHRVWFQPGDAGYPITLRWSSDQVSAICDSAVIRDEFGGIIVRAKMDQVDSVRVTHPAISSLLLIRYGAILHPASVTAGDRPATFALHQNYPNPFNPTTTIQYSLPSQSTNIAKGRDGVGSSHVTLKVYDILGREVRTLVNERKEPGTHRVEFNAEGLPSGVYYYRLAAGEFVQTRKLVLLQ